MPHLEKEKELQQPAIPSPSPNPTTNTEEINLDPDIKNLISDLESGTYTSCTGKVLNDQIVGENNTRLIKENIRWGRLTDVCIKPKYFIIHWVAKWLSTQQTKDFLEGYGFSCQFTTDPQNLWALMNLYPDRVERAACAGNKANLIALNNEISGVCFDQALSGKLVPDLIPDQAYIDFNNDVDAICNHFALNTSEGGDSKYPEIMVRNRTQDLENMTQMAIDNACKIRELYQIPVRRFIGHQEIPVEYEKHQKYDPGKKYMAKFRQRILKQCPIPQDY